MGSFNSQGFLETFSGVFTWKLLLHCYCAVSTIGSIDIVCMGRDAIDTGRVVIGES